MLSLQLFTVILKIVTLTESNVSKGLRLYLIYLMD